MPVSMQAKTSGNGGISHHHTTGKSLATKVPFKKVFSSSQLQTNGLANIANLTSEHRWRHGRASNDFGSATLIHPSLSNQLSSSLPGILDNVANGGQSNRARPSNTKNQISDLAKNSTTTVTSSGASPNRSVIGKFTLNRSNIPPFSAIEPSLIVSLSTYLSTLNEFDSEKLVREIQLMLTYFEDVVKKDKLEQLVGASTILLETVDANCVKLKEAYRQLQQVQLRLQLLLQSYHDDDGDEDNVAAAAALAKIQSSPVIEANNDLYRNLSELLQWSDRVSTVRTLIDDGDRRLSNESNVKQANTVTTSPIDQQSQTPIKVVDRPSHEQNIVQAKMVSENLLQSFKNLVIAYKCMENDLRHCYEDYLHVNKQMADLILLENSSNRTIVVQQTMRRRSITPPPDYSAGGSLAHGTSSVSHRIPNGSTSTIASSGSSSSSSSSSSTTSSHFRHRFFPNLTNHAQKMAHKMLNKSNNNNTTLSSGKKDLPSSKLDSEKVHAAWSLWPLLSNSLKRSESANDLTSLPRSTFLTIPDDSNHGNDRTQSNGRGKRSPSPFRKHSINELVSKSNESKNSEFLTPTLVSTTRRSSTSHTPPNRRSDEATNSSSSTINEIDCQKTNFISPPKEMIHNPLYYTKGQLQSTDQCETESNSLLNTQTRSSPVGSNHSQQKYSQSDSVRAEPATIQFDSISSSSSSMSSNDKPPPLPPKTYQSRSGSSTRSSIASNTSSNSVGSNSFKQHREPICCAQCSGSGSNCGKCCNILNHCPRESLATAHDHHCESRYSCCNHAHKMANHKSSGHMGNTCPHIPPPQPGNQCGCRSPPKTSSPVDLSQVTLRPKKNRGRVSSSDNDGSNSPPPLPPPDSFLFAMNDGSKSSKTIHCCTSGTTVCSDNKENIISKHHNSPSCHQNVHCTTCSDHIVQPICFYCHHHSRTSHRSPPPPPPPQIRTYRRRDGDGEHKTQSMTMTKAMRSYSIADSSTLKSSMAQLSVNCSNSMTHSTSFPFRLSHSLSSTDDDPLRPPPLPPKKRNMHAYMVVVGNYSGPIDTTELYRYSSANYTKSMIETKHGFHHSITTTTTTRFSNSASSSIMSLSSSASSNSSLCTNTSVTAATAEHMDKQQYLHLPFAPPPPTVQDDDDENNDDEKDRPSLPPRLPPRRDKLNELPLAPPPPPPPVPSSVVIQQRMQQQRSSPTNSSGGSPELIPRTSTPTRQQPDGMKTRQPACMCHHCHYQHHGQSTNQTNKDSYMLAEEDEPLEETTPILMNDDEESMQSSSHEDEVEEEEEGEEEEEEEEEVIVIEEPEKPRCCPHCSDGTMHCEEECILSQTDVPLRLMTLKSSDDQDDDLGDLTIRAGTVDALIMKASQASTTGADATYLQTFLTTYRSFLSPEQLINKLIFRYTRFTIDSEHRTDIVRKAVAGKVVAFIVLVVNEFYLYDLSKSLAQTLMDFVYQLIGRGDLAHAKCLREKCYEKLRQRDREFAAMAAAQAKLTTYNVTIRTGTLLDFKSEHIAEQMTLLDSRLFHKIEIPEILIWAKEQKEELIPNLNRFTEHFNKMSFWTRSIILSCEEPKEREKCVMKFLKIMKHLRKLNNFNSYLAILSALGSAPISRLEWSKSIQETFKDYHALIDSSSSFRTYRTVLAMTKPPCIPYIGLILQDLTFVHIGNSDYLSDGKVNVAKQFKQFSILNQFKLFQQFKYTINENEPIITFFDNFDNYLQEEVMWQISESIKPRGGGGGGTVVST